MLDSDLRLRAQKIEREQKQRVERERRREWKERASEEQARLRREEHIQQTNRRRAAALAAAEIDRLQHDEEVEHNHGVWWQAPLAAFPLDEQAARDRGIKRGSDKISLPASASNDLMAQDAPKNGAIFFELSSAEGTRTHAGLLDFSAAEGTVGVPLQAAAILWPSGTASGQQLTVTYRRLEKGTFARFQPAQADFQREVGEEVEEALVSALLLRSSLTEGDWLSVSHAGKQHRLRVQQLRPAPQISLIDTELEADVEASIETEERVRREEAALREEQAQLARRKAEEQLHQQQEAERLEAAAREASLLAAADAQRKAQEQQRRQAELPQEPEASSADSVNCLIRFPDGSRHTRRFRHSEPLSLLFAFVDAHGSAGLEPGAYRLVTQFPRRQLDGSFGGTLMEAGLSTSQEALMLEPIAAI